MSKRCSFPTVRCACPKLSNGASRKPDYTGCLRSEAWSRGGSGGGGRANSCSILEAFTIAEKFSGKKQVWTYVDESRIGDHICYISNLAKMRAHYPGWDITISLEDTIAQIVEAWRNRSA